MDKVQQSLEDNKAEVLANLPEEFHADFEKQCQDACETPAMTDDEVVKAITEGLPSDTEIAKEFEKNPVIEKGAAAPSLDEQKAAVIAELGDNEELKKDFEANADQQLGAG